MYPSTDILNQSRSADKLRPNCYCHAEHADWDSPHEVKLCISAKAKRELAAIPRGEEHILEGIIAFDRFTRKWYAIRHFPCFIDSFDCCCAAQAKLVNGPNEKVIWDPIEFPADEDDECPCCGQPRH